MGSEKLSWLVTAGPTCEDIDPVRFVSNRSSGRMGYAVARQAALRGDRVDLVSGPVALGAPEGPRLRLVRTAREMRAAVLASYVEADVVVMAAAVADFRPGTRSESKIKKSQGGLVLELEPTEDILAELGTRKASQTLVGFALEAPGEVTGAGISDEMREGARRKLDAKNLDLICLNGPGAIGADRSVVSVLRRDGGWDDWGEAPKDEHARRLVELAAAIALDRRRRRA
jgi:phosphopantothenoylcysteine decarboxylase/phosphopantothenate--cysteine ligase